MAATRTNMQCGGKMPGGTLEGLCPKCIGKTTFGLDSNGETHQSTARSDLAPAPAEPGGTVPTVHAPAPVSEQRGDRIGRYNLLQNLSRGGMGSVWLADRTEPTRWLGAIKVFKPGMDSASGIS